MKNDISKYIEIETNDNARLDAIDSFIDASNMAKSIKVEPRVKRQTREKSKTNKSSETQTTEIETSGRKMVDPRNSLNDLNSTDEFRGQFTKLLWTPGRRIPGTAEEFRGQFT